MPKKPLVEAMAQTYVIEGHRLGLRPKTWDDLTEKQQNAVMLSMTEVARMVGYFEKKGAVILEFTPEARPLPPDPPTDEHVMAAALDPTTTQGEAGTLPTSGLGGDSCGVCGQLSVVRESACRTRCMSCGAIDGGCG